MERKKGIIYLCLIVFAMMVAGSYLSRGYLPPAPESLKREMLQEMERLCPDVIIEEDVWVEENRGIREPGVNQYFGTYGDCSVILYYQAPIDVYGWPEDPPFTVSGLTRGVKMSLKCQINLFNHNPDCRLSGEDGAFATRLCSLVTANTEKLGWLTDEQLEQLTCDFDAWLAAGNY